MKSAIYIVGIFVSVVFLNTTYCQTSTSVTGTSIKIGDTEFINYSNGTTGTSTKIGDTKIIIIVTEWLERQPALEKPNTIISIMVIHRLQIKLVTLIIIRVQMVVAQARELETPITTISN